MVRSVVVSITRAMPLVGPAPSHHLHLGAAGLVKVRSLAKRIDLEFLNCLDRRGHYAGSHRAGLSTCESGEVLNVPNCVTRHVVGIVPTVDREGILIHVAAGDVAAWCYTRLQAQQ